jgi:chromosome segregation ATPase
MNERNNSTMPLAILSAALVLALAGNVALWVRTSNLTTEISKLKDNAAVQIAQLGAATEAQREETRQQIESLSTSVNSANAAASTAVKRARAEAQQQSEQLLRRLDQHSRQVAGEIGNLKDATTDASNKISEVATGISGVKSDVDGVKTEVGGVKEQVASAQSALSQHASELKRMTGDMGVMSGLIATNSKDLEALRALGERNYFEFTLSKAQKSKKVGDVILTLKKADVKRNRFTVDVQADDKRVEKKDKTINEPVQIYVAGNHLPSEIVVNRVNKDEIAGYVSTPKMTISRR